MELLLNKMREMNKKPQKYHPLSQKFYPHPTSLRFSQKNHKQFELDKSNEYLKNRVQTAKGSYSCKKSLDDYEKIKYYESQILKNSRFYNPFLNYVTPHTFEKKLAKYLLTEEAKKDEERKTCYTSSNLWSSYGSRCNQMNNMSNSKSRKNNKSQNDFSNFSSSVNSRAFSALTRSSKKSITIERSIISAKDNENNNKIKKEENCEDNVDTNNNLKTTGIQTKEDYYY